MDPMGSSPVPDAGQIERLNASGRQPLLFIHGLWLAPSSWERWIAWFEDKGYACAAPAWPGDPDDEQAAEDFSETLQDAIDAIAGFAMSLDRPPILIGHSFGGLIAQLLADRGLSAATVAIAPPAFRGVLPLPFSALRSASPVLLNPFNRRRRVALSFDQFRYAFANAVGEEEARELYAHFAVPAPGAPLFEAAFANFNPWTADQLDPRRAARGPLLLIAGEADHTVPPVVVKAEFELQRRNPGVTRFEPVAGRGHSLVIDSGWEELAGLAFAFCREFAPSREAQGHRGTLPKPGGK